MPRRPIDPKDLCRVMVLMPDYVLPFSTLEFPFDHLADALVLYEDVAERRPETIYFVERCLGWEVL